MSQTPSSKKPNLIVLLSDQQRADTLACYGNSKIHAPHLNKLAAQSVVFDRTYVTQPVCSPSRSALMTGLWPHTTGCTSNGAALESRFRVLPELLQDPDYRTAYMGKWHLGPNEFPHRGFEEWVSTQHAGDYSRFLVSKGLAPDRGNEFSEFAVSNLPVELSEPKFLEDQACAFIEKHRGEPFILFVSFVEPHPPYNGPLNEEHSPNDVELDATAIVPLPDDVPLRYRLLHEWQQDRAQSDATGKRRRFHFGLTEDDYRNLKQKYYGLITLMDRSIGAILDCVDRSGLQDNTMVAYTSDHGDTMGAHRLFGKEVMFEEAVRVPYLVRVPGARPHMVAQPVSQIDFVPTMLDLLGRPKPMACAGQSRRPMIEGETMPAESVFIEWSPNQYDRSVGQKVKDGTKLASAREITRALQESTRTVVTADGWKLSLRDKDANELYYLREDPRETRNLFYSGQHADVIERCAGEIQRWQKVTRDKAKLSLK